MINIKTKFVTHFGFQSFKTHCVLTILGGGNQGTFPSCREKTDTKEQSRCRARLQLNAKSCGLWLLLRGSLCGLQSSGRPCRAVGLAISSDGWGKSWRAFQAGKHEGRKLRGRSKNDTDGVQQKGESESDSGRGPWIRR